MRAELAALLATALSLGVAAEGCGQDGTLSEELPGKTDPAADYGDELPRIAPLPAEESRSRFRVLPGFEVSLVASEPLVADPISLSFDARGRMYVVCMRGYSEQADENRGEIRLLEDLDADGVFDRSRVFASGLSWPTGVISYGDGVYVAVAPDILYLVDEDGDGVSDSRRVVFTGFGRSNVQGLVNSLRWGLDHRIHGATSSSGGEVRRPAGGAAAVSLRGRDFAFDPRGEDLEATSGGAQHGLSFDDWGNKFVCSNSRHLEMVLFEDRYLRRNPHLVAPSPRKLIAVDGGQAEVFRLSPVEPWRIVRTRLRVAGKVPGPVEGGGRAAGYFTGSTGVTVYRGDAWPTEYRGQAFVGDVGSNIVHRKRLVPDGIAFRGIRADGGREFLASPEIWFRPVQFANAPDGCLYVLDMYREVIEHPASLPPMIKKHLDLTSGRDRGRIWRIAPSGFEARAAPRLDTASTEELVRTLAHPNGWHRDTAARLLHERQDRSAVKALRALAGESTDARGRLHALHALDGLGALEEEDVLPRLSDAQPRVREHAVLLSERLAAGATAALHAELAALVRRETDPRVRYQLAFTLGEFEGAWRDRALEALALRDGADPWMRLAVQSSLASGAAHVLSALARSLRDGKASSPVALLEDLAELAGARNRRDEVAAVLEAVETCEERGDRTLARALLGRLARGLDRSGSALRKLVASSPDAARRVFRELLSEARRVAADPRRSSAERAEAARTLGLATERDDFPVLAGFLNSRQPRELQLAALAALDRYDGPESAALLVEVIGRSWAGLSPRVKDRAADILFARPFRLELLLKSIERGEFPAADLGGTRLKLIREHADEKVRARAAVALKDLQLPRRDDVFAKYRPALDRRGDATRGRAVFEKTCASCHRVGGIGQEIGPNLVAMKNRGREAILVNVLDPGREVNPQFLNYLALTKDGRSVTGLIASETATSLTLVRSNAEKDTILRVNLEKLESTGLSLMPEGLEADFDEQGMADLLEFIMTSD